MKPPYNYGISQEDALTERRALDIREGDHLLCVASAGEVPLNMLATGPIAIEAVDISPAQLSLCRLKLAACRALEPLEAAAFLGFTDTSGENRRRLYDRTAAFLDDDEKSFWAVNASAVEKGPVRAGRFETYLGRFSPAALAVLGKKKLRRLFEQDTAAAQQEYFDRFLSTAVLKVLFKVAFHPRLYRRRGIAEEGLRHGGKHDIAAFFYGRFRDFCTATPARRNFYLHFCFFGRILFPEALPEYLSEEGILRVRENHASIAWRLESYREALGKSFPGRFNKFHLSNIGDWMGLEEYAGLLALICAKAAPSSRAISRYIHLDHPLPEALRERIVRRDDRGEELVGSDRFPFYNLVVMELR
jgi:S-adenosylmethionine-diacylglycerol 3-amino-3-carboxypropyl transferase